MYYRPQPSSCFFQPPPIDSLPVELLAYIFVLGTHEPIHPPNSERQDDDCQPFNSESVKAPLVYASVSRHWRSVALNTPALYTSLCITPELFREVGNKEVLDTTGISSYLALSRNYLVDILIDARDQEWDFDDDGAWFSAEHMSTAMGVLLPHLRRWRSLSILTDVYAPMHAALRPLEVYLSAYGAPHLESLRLFRCDAYAAHAPVVEPEHVFLSSMTKGGWKLPNLRHLNLRGVPAAWTPLAALLPDSLQTLELSFHPLAVQPTVPELTSLLKAAPQLCRLVINGSGPAFPDISADPSPPTSIEPVSLPLLTSLTLGYISAAAGLALFDLLDAPHLHTLALEDATHPADTVPVDAVPLLARLFPLDIPPQFPALADLALRRAHLAGPPPALRVARLELEAMDPSALAALEPTTHTLCIRGPLAAPSAFPLAPAAALAATGAALRALVEKRGPAAPRVICLHEAAYASRGEAEEEFCLGGTRVRFFRRFEGEEDGDEDEDTVMGSEPECGWDGYGEDEAEAFKVGGVFNDPVFDARYGYVG
ncbi:F-box domain-containing protein [Mycena venus]|uniref:F-box domain-containing protein n=1 Tax=Mycena venus TaxID=2733690 RepID=A0A8H6YY93_9AGAR|nr:F-box domain-containing protein [Mycena venus]